MFEYPAHVYLSLFSLLLSGGILWRIAHLMRSAYRTGGDAMAARLERRNNIATSIRQGLFDVVVLECTQLRAELLVAQTRNEELIREITLAERVGVEEGILELEECGYYKGEPDEDDEVEDE